MKRRGTGKSRSVPLKKLQRNCVFHMKVKSRKHERQERGTLREEEFIGVSVTKAEEVEKRIYRRVTQDGIGRVNFNVGRWLRSGKSKRMGRQREPK